MNSLARARAFTVKHGENLPPGDAHVPGSARFRRAVRTRYRFPYLLCPRHKLFVQLHVYFFFFSPYSFRRPGRIFYYYFFFPSFFRYPARPLRSRGVPEANRVFAFVKRTRDDDDYTVFLGIDSRAHAVLHCTAPKTTALVFELLAWSRFIPYRAQHAPP